MITIKVPGNSVAQGRPRFFRHGNFTGCYDPKKSKSWKKIIAWSAIQQGAVKLKGAIKFEINFYLPGPKSSKSKIAQHIKKPDLDNLIKAVLDALKGICFEDDSQITILFATKHYAIDFAGVVINYCEVPG